MPGTAGCAQQRGPVYGRGREATKPRYGCGAGRAGGGGCAPVSSSPAAQQVRSQALRADTLQDKCVWLAAMQSPGQCMQARYEALLLCSMRLTVTLYATY